MEEAETKLRFQWRDHDGELSKLTRDGFISLVWLIWDQILEDDIKFDWSSLTDKFDWFEIGFWKDVIKLEHIWNSNLDKNHPKPITNSPNLTNETSTGKSTAQTIWPTSLWLAVGARHTTRTRWSLPPPPPISGASSRRSRRKCKFWHSVGDNLIRVLYWQKSLNKQFGTITKLVPLIFPQ